MIVGWVDTFMQFVGREIMNGTDWWTYTLAGVIALSFIFVPMFLMFWFTEDHKINKKIFSIFWMLTSFAFPAFIIGWIYKWSNGNFLPELMIKDMITLPIPFIVITFAWAFAMDMEEAGKNGVD
jgi:hypothetical protein